jgi:large conductance mechanosensitive channel
MKGFKDFLMQGNLLDLAVAVVIGGAFGEGVKSFTAMFMDLLGKIGATPNFSAYAPGGVHVGAFLTAVISFVIVGAVIYFLVVKPIVAMKARKAGTTPDAPPTTEDLLAEIRDLLARKA